jgi:large subunit ribosomal protein L28
MAKCEVCDKGIQTGHRVSITRSQVSRRANKIWRSNIKKVQIVEKNGAVRRAKVCTRCLRSKMVTRSV